jgi:hypothetical protein
MSWGVYFADGRNLTDSYFGLGLTGMNYTGRDLMIQDFKAAEEAALSFEAIHKSGLVQVGRPGGEPSELNGSCLTQDLSPAQCLLLKSARGYVQELPVFS